MQIVDIEKLYEIAGNEVENFADELYGFDLDLSAQPEIRRFLFDKRADRSVRKEILGDLDKNHSELFKNFLELLLNENLLPELSLLAKKLVALVEARKKVRFAQIFTPFELEEKRLAEIKKKLAMNIRLKMTIDKSLIGGMVLKFADGKVLNVSVKNQLAELKARIAQ